MRKEIRERAPPYDRTDVFLQQQAHIVACLFPLALEMGQFHFHQRDHRTESRALPGATGPHPGELGYEDPEMEAWMLGILFDGIPLDYMMLGERMPIKRIEQYIYKNIIYEKLDHGPGGLHANAAAGTILHRSSGQSRSGDAGKSSIADMTIQIVRPLES